MLLPLKLALLTDGCDVHQVVRNGYANIVLQLDSNSILLTLQIKVVRRVELWVHKANEAGRSNRNVLFAVVLRLWDYMTLLQLH